MPTTMGSGVGSNLLADVATVIVADCLGAVGADAGYVATVSEDGEALAVSRVTPYSATPVHLKLRATDPYPLAETIRTGKPMFITNNDQLSCDHPGLVRVVAEDHACATLPLVADDGEVLGALNLGYAEPHEFTPYELELIDLLVRHCARAMSLARELDYELRRRTAS